MATTKNHKAIITRIYVDGKTCYVHLDGRGEGYFMLQKSHSNYESIYSLILLAASNRYVIWLRTVEDRPEKTDTHVTIAYAVVDW